MSVYKVLADIVDALRTSHLEHQTMATKQDLAEGLAAVRAEMATKQDLAEGLAAVRAEMATKQDLAEGLAAVRAEMATKQDLAEGLAAVRAEMAAGFAGLTEQIRKLGLEFEEFRHNSKIALEMISSLMTTVNRHDSDIARLGRRVTRVERHLDLPPLPNGK